METVPCLHHADDGSEHGTCALGRSVPRDCGPGCKAYAPALSDDERQRCEIWTRVMGYHRPVSAFNAGKRQEHADRQYFHEPT